MFVRKVPTTLEEALLQLSRALSREEKLKNKCKKLEEINEQFLKAHILEGQKPKN